MGVAKVSISKSDLQGHSRARTIGHVRFSISVLLQLCLYI